MKQVYLFQVRSTRAAEREGRWYNAIIVTAATLSVDGGGALHSRAVNAEERRNCSRRRFTTDPPRARAAFSAIECVIHHWHNLERQLNYGRDSNVVIDDRTNGRQTGGNENAILDKRPRAQASFAKSLLPPSVSAHNEVVTEKQKKKREADLRKEDPEELLIFDSTPTSSSLSFS